MNGSLSTENWFNSFVASTPGWTLMVMLFMIVIFVWTFSRKFTLRYVRSAPTIFTTVGIFFTFVGISLSLFSFNTKDLQNSLPAFLSGMKTAFYISILGVLFSLAIKIRYALFGLPKKFQNVDPDPASELVRHHLTLHRLLSGGETPEERLPLSVLMAGMRKETREGLGAIKQTLEQYLSKMAESNSRVLMEALQNVLKSFESRVNESTASSMKELSLAVKEIVNWQSGYRDAMPRITAELVKIAEPMEKIGESLRAYAEQAEIFRQFFEKQGTVLLKMDAERERVEKALNGFMRVMESQEKGLSSIEKSLTELTGSLSGNLEAEGTRILAQIEKNSEALSQSMDRNRADFERLLQRALSQSIQGLGEQLAALSEKFVQDYTPLTERLQNVLKIAEQARR
ncbi:MAG: hypothetical protein ACP5OP_07460 [Leptospirillia bacterium]